MNPLDFFMAVAIAVLVAATIATTRWGYKNGSVPTWFWVILLMVLVLAVVLAATTGSGARSNFSSSTDLATLGSLAGAIFTVGGLVLALAAVLTQLTLEERTRTVVEKKFSELLPQFTERADARIKWFEAASKMEGSIRSDQYRVNRLQWEILKPRMEEALLIDPSIPEGWSRIGLAGANSILSQIWLSGEAREYDKPPPRFEVMSALQKAIEQNDTKDGRVFLALAQLHALEHNLNDMFEMLQRIEPNEANEKFRRGAINNLAKLVDGDYPTIHRICTYLKFEFPASIEKMLEFLPSNEPQTWVATLLPNGDKSHRISDFRLPLKVVLHKCTLQSGGIVMMPGQNIAGPHQENPIWTQPSISNTEQALRVRAEASTLNKKTNALENIISDIGDCDESKALLSKLTQRLAFIARI